MKQPHIDQETGDLPFGEPESGLGGGEPGGVDAYDDRTSDAAVDQGWGQVDIADLERLRVLAQDRAAEEAPNRNYIGHGLEMPGRSVGRLASHHVLPRPGAARQHMGDGELAHRRGLAKDARAAIREQHGV